MVQGAVVIPKIIHYCWFGGNPIPECAQQYINGWKAICPDYELREWNESNFDITCNDYVMEAYKAKKWAFVTDYVRLYALLHHGGLYMDTDVEVIRPLDRFLAHDAFSGFENPSCVPTGIMGSIPGHHAIKELLDQYDGSHFIADDGSMDMSTNVERITDYFIQRGLMANNELQTVAGFTFYPTEFFCPKDSQTFEIKATSNTYTIHHFSGTWLSRKDKLKQVVKKTLGPRATARIASLLGKRIAN